MPKLISFSNVVVQAYKECTNLYGSITNYGYKFISNYEYLYSCSYKLLRKKEIVKIVSEVLQDNIDVGKEYYFLSSLEKLEEQVALVLAFKLKKQVKELSRTIKFCTDLYRKNKFSFFDDKFILLLNRQCGKLSISYEVFELFLIVFEYFYNKKSLSYETSIKISFRKLDIICPGVLSKIFEGKELDYISFSNLIKCKVKTEKNVILSKLDFISLPKMYKEI